MLKETIRRHASDRRPLLDDLKIAGFPGKEAQASLHAALLPPHVGLVNLPRLNTVLAKKTTIHGGDSSSQSGNTV